MKDPWGRLIARPETSEPLPVEALVFEPRAIYDKAICGTVMADGVRVAAYDREAICHALVDEGLTADEAYEWISYNTEGAYLGPSTPVVLPLDRETDSVEVAMKLFAQFVGGTVAEA